MTSESSVSQRPLGINQRVLKRLVQNSDKQMNLIFDGYSKSKAPLQLIVIRARGLADEALIAELSEELREDTDPGRHGWL